MSISFGVASLRFTATVLGKADSDCNPSFAVTVLSDRESTFFLGLAVSPLQDYSCNFARCVPHFVESDSDAKFCDGVTFVSYDTVLQTYLPVDHAGAITQFRSYYCTLFV